MKIFENLLRYSANFFLIQVVHTYRRNHRLVIWYCIITKNSGHW